MPALTAVLVVFALIVILNRFKVDLGLSIITGSIALGLWFGMGTKELALMLLSAATSEMCIILVLLVALILTMNQMMGRTGQQERMVSEFAKIITNKKTILASMPALIGLLPMPGGAIFSAPMVGTLSKDLDLKPGVRTALNYWYRHIWEFWWPMYPGVILALSLTGMGVFKFIAMQSVFTLVTVTLGYFFILRMIPDVKKDGTEKEGRSIKKFIENALPILVIFGVMIVLSLSRPLWEGSLISKGTIAQYFPIFAGLIVSNLLTYFKGGLKLKDAIEIVFNRKLFQLLALVVAIIIYKTVLNESGAVLGISGELKAYNIPIIAVVMLLPFISGTVIGVAIGFVGASFPLIISLIDGLPGEAAYISLAYTFGFVGMLLSPIHVCFVLTKNYFNEDFSKTYKYIVPCCIGLAVAAIGWFFLIKNFV